MNYIESLLSAEFIRAFAWTLFHSLWQGGLIALLAAGLMLILRKHQPGIRYAILYILLMLLPVLFASTFLMIYHPGNGNHNGIENTIILGTANEITGTATTGSEISQDWYSHPVLFFEHQARWLVLIWFTGFLIFLLRFSGSVLYIYRLKNYQVYEAGEHWDTSLRMLADRIGLHEPVRLAESAMARVPMTIGYLKPVILLPLGTLSGVPPQQIDAILLHELAHILRKDYLLNILQSVTESLFFYHPATWWISGLIRQERELICDDLAVGVNHDQINYIKALTTMEELNSKSPSLANAMISSKKKLLFRVKRLLNPVKLRNGFGEGIIASILLIGLILALSLNALSFIPSSFDLTGREFGEKIFNILPFNPVDHTKTISETSTCQQFSAPVINNEMPDTTVARSKSGNVVIKVYTDSTGQVKQEDLDRIAENMDKQSQERDKQMKEYMIRIGDLDAQKKKCDEQCKVIVIQKSDSTLSEGDSVIMVYSDVGSSRPGNGCFLFSNDSIDSLLFKGQGGLLNIKDLKGLEWSDKDLDNKLKNIEIEIEKSFPEGKFENQRYYFNEPVPQPELPGIEYSPEHQGPSPEKIIRQELRDDGLTMPRKGYIIDIDSKGMYINGEKQSKEVYRKYKRLVESLDVGNIEGGENYRLVF
jgi:beta-lactamase regulating signal transducer with metallopeptidase domain